LLSALRAPEDHPGLEILRKRLETVLDSGIDENDVAGSDRVNLSGPGKGAAPAITK
jgi:hypothetical protein